MDSVQPIPLIYKFTNLQVQTKVKQLKGFCEYYIPVLLLFPEIVVSADWTLYDFSGAIY